MSRRPFRVVRFEFGPGTDDPEVRANSEHGFALWPFDQRPDGDEHQFPGAIPTHPSHLAVYGLGPCITVTYGPQTGVTWQCYTDPEWPGCALRDMDQMQWGLTVARLLIEEMEADPGAPGPEILFGVTERLGMPVRPVLSLDRKADTILGPPRTSHTPE